MSLEGIARRAFLVVGRVGMDLTPMPPGTPTAQARDMFVSMGGSSANIAAGLVRLGCTASLVTRVSDDAVGRYCLAQLDRYGIGRTHVGLAGGEARTSLAVVEAKVEDHQSVIYRNGAADFEMDVAEVEAVDLAPFGALVTAGTVFAAEPSRSAAFRALERARDAGLTVIFDVDYRPYSWPSPAVAEEVLSRAAALADMVVGNDEEFGFMAGGIERGRDMARRLAATGAVAIYKRGPEGAETYRGDECMRTGVFPVEAMKPTGAGDSFLAGLLAGLADGLAFRDAVLQGSAAAAIVVTRPGCAPAMPDRAELAAFLRDHPTPTP
ncbi:5-dehydro-2-deoxygluconokinase [Jannaschia sp. W003]|uniref:5-dehydro-2-deoxygluconokinase n=1 Tax=Jannaschia sp. W003 TaxID=2867012 RepID=UPI0021A589CE|nr:5-dehydro-2-deoxygluconokinase [Jannaschia sp. W003]UWQ20199.1 5-dehydro-2-deoxygluconokinase [Jannaschia sp. W003]